ncbi:hypothetical protein ACLI4Y_09720 [Natrialbaceae archaeon A-CW3]
MSPETEERQPLVLPTDERILKILDSGKRQTPKNIAAFLDDADPSYMSNRLRVLEKRGYVNSPGPAERSGMYEITTWGRVATHRINKYNRGYDGLFHLLVIRTAETQDEELPAQIQSDWIQLTDDEIDALIEFVEIGGVTIPSDFPNYYDEDISANDAAEMLYTFYFYGFAERHEGMDAYSPTHRAKSFFKATKEKVAINSLKDGCRIPSDNTGDSAT